MISGLGQRLYGIGNGSSAEATARAAVPFSSAAIRFSNTSVVGIGQPAVNISASVSPNRAAAWAQFSNTKDVLA